MRKYVLKTLKNEKGRHIVRDGEDRALCGFPVNQGAWISKLYWVGQVGCRACLRVHKKDIDKENDG